MEQEKVYDNPGRCDLCRNLVRLTDSENLIIQPKLSAIGGDEWMVWGACLRPQREPRLLIRRYIFQIHKECLFFEKGFYKELLGIPCPECYLGQLSVIRPKINERTVIILGCNRYPDCRYTAHSLTLKTLCRFCKVPLVLTGGDLLKASCPQCKRSLSIPISMKTWPGLIQPEGGCVHFADDVNCTLCNSSRSLRKSLIDLELPSLIRLKNHPNNNNTLINLDGLLRNAQNEEINHQPEVDADYLEKVENYFEYVRDYHTIIVENGDDRWEENVDDQHSAEED